MSNVSFDTELCRIINEYSKENKSNTPDFILAQYISDCLAAFNLAVQRREKWYDRENLPSVSKEIYEYKWLAELMGSNGTYVGANVSEQPWSTTLDPYKARQFESEKECQEWIDAECLPGLFIPTAHGFEVS